MLSVLLSVIRGKHQHLFELRCEKCTKPRPADLICSPRISIWASRGFCYPGILVGGFEKCYPENRRPGVIRKAPGSGVIRLLSGKMIGFFGANYPPYNKVAARGVVLSGDRNLYIVERLWVCKSREANTHDEDTTQPKEDDREGQGYALR